MNNTYSEQELSLIIPTLGRNVDGLKHLVNFIRQESNLINIIIVWDHIDNIPSELKKLFEKNTVKVVKHSLNRGLSAARNSGIKHCQTNLGMFIDDDICPNSGFIDKVLKFHIDNPAVLDMFIGKVTWQGGRCQSTLTDWYETNGNWIVLANSHHMQKLSNFMGGFTSFKCSAFEQLSFDESFKKYGCEDTEFGYRFFALGGRLFFLEGVVGVHEKELSLHVYCKQHIEAGYSKALLSILHPDSVFKMESLYQSLSLYRSPISQEECQILVSSLLTCQNQSRIYKSMLNLNMQFLSEMCMSLGYIDYFIEHFVGFKEGIEELLCCESMTEFNELCMNINDVPFFLLEKAKYEKDIPEKTSLLLLTSKMLPRYAAPLLALVCIDPLTWKSKLATFYAEHKYHLDLNTLNVVKKQLGEFSDVDTAMMSARDKYLYLLDRQSELTESEIVDECRSILIIEPTFVSVYLMLANIDINKKQYDLARLNLTIALCFSKQRPLNERLQRESEIEYLMGQLG